MAKLPLERELYWRSGLEENVNHRIPFPHFLSYSCGILKRFSLFSVLVSSCSTQIFEVSFSGMYTLCRRTFSRFCSGGNWHWSQFWVSWQKEELRWAGVLSGILQLILLMMPPRALLFSFVDSESGESFEDFSYLCIHFLLQMLWAVFFSYFFSGQIYFLSWRHLSKF